MKYIDILGTLINLANVNYVEKQEDEGLFIIHLQFQDGAYCTNRFETKEEQEALYAMIKSAAVMD